MKAKIQVLIASLALAGLLHGPAAAATDLARLPLKASVLAKPNVIFGMDDSGSMDWEVLLDTNSGVVWWDGSGAWSAATGKPNRTSRLVPYAYLFPVGDADGGQIYGYNSTYGQAAPPIAQLAWLRSAAYNGLYYDPRVTYKPWASAYVDGAVRNYLNASAAGAPSHPVHPAGAKLKLDADWSSASANWDNTAGAYRFYVQEGMTLPVGTRVRAETTSSGVCSGNVERNLTAATAVANGRACWASVPYRPASYWHPENCALGANCVVAPDGATRLRLYEIRPGVNAYPSGRGYEQELQNFANWFSYYRKRKLMLAGSMGMVLEGLTGLRLGVVPFNDRQAVSMKDTDAAPAADNGQWIVGKFYKNAMAPRGTPTHATVKSIGGQYESNLGVVQYACQRNNMFVVTDGFANAHEETAPGYDAARYGAGAPYAATAKDSLADFALAYYTNRLRSADMVAGRVPPNPSNAPGADKNADLHVNTHAISLGVRGSIWPFAGDPFKLAPVWPVPVADTPSMVDDLWHATLNGRGSMFLASTPTETAAGIQAILDDIIRQTGAQGGLAVSTVNLSRGDSRAYFGTYNPSGWTGDLTAHPIDAATGAVDGLPAHRLWSAADKLAARAWGTRSIMSHDGVASVPFTSAKVGARVNPAGVHGATDDVINYLRGDRSGEGAGFRKRGGLLGAVINSEPTIDRANRVAYVQSGEGMLHAFDTSAGAAGGNELWAFVPNQVLGSIGETSKRGYVFRTQLDGPITLAEFGAAKLLVAGMGAAGKGYYAMDVSKPRTLGEASLPTVWQFPAAGDAATQAKMGQTVGKARVVRHPALGWVVLVTSGYNAAADGKGRLWMLDAATGAIVKEFVTADGGAAAEAGLAQVTAFVEDDGSTQFVYGGDLLGNLWKFDLVAHTTSKVAVLKNGAGQSQPVTAAPELTRIEGQRVVFVGTGRLLDIGDFGGVQVQTMYAIADGAPLANARAALQVQTYTNDTTITSHPVDWVAQRGWYVDLPAGEKANTQPSIAYGALAFVTNSNGATNCMASAKLYAVDVKTGGNFAPAGFVSWTISDTSNSSGVTALVTVAGKVVGAGQDADGKPWKRELADGNLITPAKNAWIELRNAP